MKILKLISLVIGVMLLASGVSWAAGGSTGANFLLLGGGARPLGMGEAYTALADDASSMFYNPAGLSNVNFNEIMTMYNNWFSGITQQMAGGAFPTNFGVVAVGYSGLNSGDIQGYDANGAATSAFTTSSSSINLSLGRRISSNLSLGAGVRSISERLESNRASTIAFDAGLKYRFNTQLTVGLSVLNLGSGLKFITEQTPLPTSYRVGAAFATTMFDEDLNLDLDIVNYTEASKVNLGIEYIIRDFLSLRLGNSGGIFRAGLGLTANLFAFDYAYLGHQDLGSTHQLSISVLFGAPEKRKKDILDYLAQGKAYMQDRKYSSAIVKLEKVISMDPRNEEADILMRKAQANLEQEAFEKVFAEREVEVKRGTFEIMDSGKKYLALGKYLEALAEFSKALKLEPTNREALKLQSEAQTKMESQLIEQSQQEAKGYLGEAMRLVVIGNYKDAAHQVDLALSKDPRNKQAQDLKKKLDLILKIEKK